MVKTKEAKGNRTFNYFIDNTGVRWNFLKYGEVLVFFESEEKIPRLWGKSKDLCERENIVTP